MCDEFYTYNYLCPHDIINKVLFILYIACMMTFLHMWCSEHILTNPITLIFISISPLELKNIYEQPIVSLTS